MNKKVTLGAIISLGLAFCGLNSHASATEIEPHSYQAGEVTYISEDHCVLEGDIGIPCPAECFDEDGEFQACFFNEETQSYETYENLIHEGTSGEPEVICADENEPGCKDEEDTSEPALWPMIISFAALGIAFVLIIIINLTHRRK